MELVCTWASSTSDSCMTRLTEWVSENYVGAGAGVGTTASRCTSARRHCGGAIVNCDGGPTGGRRQAFGLSMNILSDLIFSLDFHPKHVRSETFDLTDELQWRGVVLIECRLALPASPTGELGTDLLSFG